MPYLDLLLASLPILCVLALILGLRWKSTHAGIAGWAVALLVAGLRFGTPLTTLLWAQVRGLFLALYVLYIIWGALLFYRTTEAAGAIQAMGDLVRQLSANPALQALLLAWGLASFLQGVGGFGVPVAVVAPLMVELGYPVVAAVVLPALGHTWAVSFGSLGSSFYALMATTNMDGAVLAPWSALALGVVCFIMGTATLGVAGGKTALRQGWLPLLLMGTAMSGVQWLTAVAGLWNIAAALGALAGLLVGGIWARLRAQRPWEPAVMRPIVRQALVPYAILLLLIFVAQSLPPLKALLDLVQLRARVPQLITGHGAVIPAGFTRTLSLFGHTGALLIYASLLSGWLAQRSGALKPHSWRAILRQVVRSGISSTVGILTMVALATTMDHAGMVTLLSQNMAEAAGRFFPLVSPFIGALGAFVTGSNTNSNVLFAALQQDAAQALGYAAPIILAAQNAGGAIGSTFAPAKILVACSTVQQDHVEGQVLRHLLRYALPTLAALAVLTWVSIKIVG